MKMDNRKKTTGGLEEFLRITAEREKNYLLEVSLRDHFSERHNYFLYHSDDETNLEGYGNRMRNDEPSQLHPKQEEKKTLTGKIWNMIIIVVLLTFVVVFLSLPAGIFLRYFRYRTLWDTGSQPDIMPAIWEDLLIAGAGLLLAAMMGVAIYIYFFAKEKKQDPPIRNAWFGIVYFEEAVKQLEHLLYISEVTFQYIYKSDYLPYRYRYNQKEAFAVSAFYNECVASGRCSSLSGNDGAYELLQKEKRNNNIVVKTERIFADPLQLKVNQEYLYKDYEYIINETDRIGEDSERLIEKIDQMEFDELMKKGAKGVVKELLDTSALYEYIEEQLRRESEVKAWMKKGASYMM